MFISRLYSDLIAESELFEIMEKKTKLKQEQVDVVANKTPKAKINNATQDILKSLDSKMTLDEALKKLDNDGKLANASNRTSAKNSDVMNEFKNEFDKLTDKFVKDGKFTKKGKKVTVLNVDKDIRLPKMYFATDKKK